MSTTDKEEKLSIEDAVAFVLKALKDGKAKVTIKNELMVQTGWKKTKAYEVIKDAETQVTSTTNQKTEEVEQVDEEFIQADVLNDEFVEKKGYFYNPNTGQYVLEVKSVPSGYVVFTAERMQMIRWDYTEGKRNLSDLSMKYSIPKNVLTEVFAKLGLAHNSVSATDEELETVDTQQLVKNSLMRKRFEFQQTVEKEQWREIQSNSKKWNEFVYKELDPFKNLLDNWVPPDFKPLPVPIIKPTVNGRVFVVGAFDWHIGAMAEAKYLMRGKDFSMKVAKELIERYAKSVQDRVITSPYGYEKGIILFGGDLYHTLTGFTANGTKIETEVNGDTQFEAVMNMLVYFINAMTSIFTNVDIHFVRGNHGGITDIPLAHAVKNYFRTVKKVNFNIYSERTAVFKQGNTVIAFEHGASDYISSKVPQDEKGLDNYVNNVFLSKPELLSNSKQRLFIMGDKHHFIQKERSNFEFIQVGALPLGDKYANALGLYNRPRQNCLVIGPDGLESTVHVYFD